MIEQGGEEVTITRFLKKTILLSGALARTIVGMGAITTLFLALKHTQKRK